MRILAVCLSLLLLGLPLVQSRCTALVLCEELQTASTGWEEEVLKHAHVNAWVAPGVMAVRSRIEFSSFKERCWEHPMKEVPDQPPKGC